MQRLYILGIAVVILSGTWYFTAKTIHNEKVLTLETMTGQDKISSHAKKTSEINKTIAIECGREPVVSTSEANSLITNIEPETIIPNGESTSAPTKQEATKSITPTEKMLEEIIKVTKKEAQVEPLRWKPEIGVSWQWQLSGPLNISYDVDVYDVDLFDVSATQIAQLQNRGSKVLCYFSAGSYEDWRQDAKMFPSAVLGEKLYGWAGEKWIDISAFDSFAHIMEARLDLASTKGCDGVEPDNVDGYQNKSGFTLTSSDQLAYNTFLANAAHERGLAIALKNDLNQIPQLVSLFDLAINEQCFKYDECSLLQPFIASNKPVLGVEYELELDDFCTEANKMNFSWLKMEKALDGGRKYCE